jgi:hypothetical protein
VGTVADVLDQIDAALAQRCACGCDRPLDPDGPSAWFATADCQWTWQNSRATHPNDVYNRPDAAAYPLHDAAVTDLNESRPVSDHAASVGFDLAVDPALLLASTGPNEIARLAETFRRLAAAADPLAEARQSPALACDRRPPERGRAIVTDSRPPVIAAAGVPSGLRYRRWCERCREAREPVLGLLARVRPFNPGDYSVGTAEESRGPASQSVDHAHIAWRDLEHELEERRRPVCVVPGCEAKARETYVVQHRPGHLDLRLCGRSWRPDDRIELCPQHGYRILRGEDPANPGPVLDELTFPPIGIQLSEARHG